MNKIGALIILTFFTFACTTKNKPVEENASTEINIENLVEVTIPVNGMTCEGCENAIKKSIGTLEGIAEVSASHIDSCSVVKYDKTATTLAEIEGKIADAGYTVARDQ